MRNLAGKRALITGAASGIGKAIALRLASEQVNLLLVDIDQVGLERTAIEARAGGVEVETRQCDVSDPAQISAVTGDAIERWAGVDLLVNNAGVTYHGFLHAMPADEWDRLLAVNLHSHLRFTRELLPGLLARPGGHVLNIGSVLGLVGMPRVSVYCATKFGLVGFSDSLRAEYGRWGLGVTTLCPGFVRTGLFESARPEQAGDAPKTPPRWLCTTPEKIAKAAVRAVKRNQGRVMVEPFARFLYGAKTMFPSAIDWAMRLGVNKRLKRHRQHLAQLSDNPTEALRLCIAEQQARSEEKRRAA